MQKKYESVPNKTNDFLMSMVHRFNQYLDTLLNNDVDVTNVPSEVLIKIFSELKHPNELINLMLVSSQFHNIIMNELLWRTLGINTSNPVPALYRNQLINTKGAGVVLAHETQQELQNNSSCLKILLLGEGKAGELIESASKDIDPMGYAYDCGAALKFKYLNQQGYLRICSNLMIESSHSSLQKIRSQQVRSCYEREFTKNRSEGGAQIVFLSFDRWGWEISLKQLAQDPLLKDRLIFITTEHSSLNNISNYNTTDYAKFLSVKFPEIHDRVAGFLNVRASNPVSLFESIFNQMHSLIHEKAFACTKSSFLSELPTEVKREIFNGLDKKETKQLSVLSKGFHHFFKPAENQTLNRDASIKEENTLEKCCIM
jgi:hypothetical protein